MIGLCEIDASGLTALLPSLKWPRSGVVPYDGSFGMLGWGSLPTAFGLIADAVIARIMRELPGRRCGVVFVARLISGQRVPVHVDAEDGNCRMRIHVPLLTNQQALFITGGIKWHMPIGWAWMIDPTQEHSAFNGGETDRVHLMFNAVEG